MGLFSRDVGVQRTECRGVPIGSKVSFQVQMRNGQPFAYSLGAPPDAQGLASIPDRAAPVEGLSGMAAIMAHAESHAKPSWNDAALDWKHSKSAGTGMDSLLAHKNGPGKSLQ